MTEHRSPVVITKHSAAYWRITIDSPPINLLDPELFAGLQAALKQLEADPDVTVVVFDSTNPEFFVTHVDLTRIAEFDLAAWNDFGARLERAPFISIASVRGRLRGGGQELMLATDLRFASRERAIFGQPEVGLGIIPGGGGLERLWRLIGKARALEVIATAGDYDADTAERYGWINRAIPDADLDSFVDRMATKLATFDRAALAATKARLNEEAGTVPLAEIETSQKSFLELVAAPAVQARIPVLLGLGLQTYGPLELGTGELSGWPAA